MGPNCGEKDIEEEIKMANLSLDVCGVEDDDDDGDEDQTESTGNLTSGVDILDSSIRFAVAETNSIRETLGLKPIVLSDDETDDDVDDDYQGDDDDDDDDDDLEMLSSYAE